MRLPDEALALMPAQHGLITRRQLTGMGCSGDAVDSMVRRALLERVYRGVYRWPGGATPAEQLPMAAVLRCGRDARAAGVVACALHGLEGFSLGPRPEVVVPPERWLRNVPFAVRYGPFVEPADRATVKGVPTVSAARALVDVAATVSTKRLRVGIDSARREGLLSIDWLARRAEAQGGAAGARAVLRLLGTGAMEQESEGRAGHG